MAVLGSTDVAGSSPVEVDEKIVAELKIMNARLSDIREALVTLLSAIEIVRTESEGTPLDG